MHLSPVRAKIVKRMGGFGDYEWGGHTSMIGRKGTHPDPGGVSKPQRAMNS